MVPSPRFLQNSAAVTIVSAAGLRNLAGRTHRPAGKARRRGAAPLARKRAMSASPRKFTDPFVTAKGERRAWVALAALTTLWFNTGTLCNITCAHCYIESSPRNDRLAWLSRADVAAYLDEIARDGLPTRTIGFTGGEPFMNRDLVGMLDDVLARGLSALVLTNAMKPMQHR